MNPSTSLRTSYTPLAEVLRPADFSSFIGQEHLVGAEGIITKLVKSNNLPSLMLWGPPGSGKTTLAHLIARSIDAQFIPLSAVTAKLDDIRRIVKEAKLVKDTLNRRTILFIDEIHRFSKAQQDAFLPHVENGTIILIGATTENPSFEIISPLLSRSRVLVLKQLTAEQLHEIAQKAFENVGKKIEPDALSFLLEAANGDARSLITTIEVAASIVTSEMITMPDIEQAIQKKQLQYDRVGEEHYNTISAFIKSMRASQPDAAVYYLARMVEAGEDPLFIARRMVIFASEDIGLAQPTALVVANEVFRSCEVIGYPECAINLAHGVVYLSLCKKDRRAYDALRAAQDDVHKYGNLPIPLHIRNAPTKLMKELGYGKGYTAYTQESYLPEKLKDKKYIE